MSVALQRTAKAENFCRDASFGERGTVVIGLITQPGDFNEIERTMTSAADVIAPSRMSWDVT